MKWKRYSELMAQTPSVPLTQKQPLGNENNKIVLIMSEREGMKILLIILIVAL